MTGLEYAEHPPWRRCAVFVSSTFRDMDRERDVIARVIIPEVNARLRRRGIMLYPVDLRWGIETDDRQVAEQRQRTILEVCAREVRRCRPLFVGLLGDRYGWLPPPNVASSARRAAGIADPSFPLSALALEILVALDESVRDGIAPILLGRQVGSTGARDSNAPPDAALLDRLIAHLRASGHRLETYHVAGASGDRLDSHDFADILIARLEADAARLAVADEPEQWLVPELRAQRWAADAEADGFVGREEELDFLVRFWDPLDHTSDMRNMGDNPGHPLRRLRASMHDSALVVSGESGSGKSALLAAATKLSYPSAHPKLPAWISQIAFARVGLTPASERLPVCLLLLLAQLDYETAREIAELHPPTSVRLEDVLDVWVSTLERHMAGFGPLVIVDGVDQLVGTATIEPLAWMPTSIADRARFLVSVSSPVFERILGLRPATEILHLAPLEPADAATLVRSRVNAHHRALSGDLVELLATRSQSARWLVVATDLLLTLTAHDYLFHRQHRHADPERALRELLREIAAGLPTQLHELHEDVYLRLSELTEIWLPVAIALLGETLFGLRPEDLVAVLESLGQRVSAADVALGRALLGTHVSVDRPLWSFVHQSAKEGAELLAVSASDAVPGPGIGLRRALAVHLTGLPVDDSVRERELLCLLLFEAEPGLLARFVHRAELSTPTGLSIFAATLVDALAKNVPLTEILVEVFDAAEAEERATLAEFLIGAVVPVITGEARAVLLVEIESRLRALDANARSRFGHSRALLLETVHALTFDPLRPANGHWITEFVRWAAAARRGEATLTGAPQAPATVSELDVWGEVVRTTVLLTFYATAVRERRLSPSPDDLAETRRRLAATRARLAGTPPPFPGGQEFGELNMLAAKRAAALVWPAEGFAPDASDLARAERLVDHARGFPEFVALLGRIARLHAIGRVWPLDDPSRAEHAPVLYEAIQLLERTLWQIGAQRELTPGYLAVEEEWMLCSVLHSSLLSVCEQDSSACRSGYNAVSSPLAVQVLGPDYIPVAVDVLADWGQYDVDIDARDVLARVVEQARAVHAGAPTRIEESEALLVFAVLSASLRAAAEFRDFDIAVAMTHRACEIERDGPLVPTEPDLELGGVVREKLMEWEDEWHEDVADDFVLEWDVASSEMREEMRNVLSGFAAIAEALTSHPHSTEDDHLSAEFWRLMSMWAQEGSARVAADDGFVAILTMASQRGERAERLYAMAARMDP